MGVGVGVEGQRLHGSAQPRDPRVRRRQPPHEDAIGAFSLHPQGAGGFQSGAIADPGQRQQREGMITPVGGKGRLPRRQPRDGGDRPGVGKPAETINDPGKVGHKAGRIELRRKIGGHGKAHVVKTATQLAKRGGSTGIQRRRTQHSHVPTGGNAVLPDPGAAGDIPPRPRPDRRGGTIGGRDLAVAQVGQQRGARGNVYPPLNHCGPLPKAVTSAPMASTGTKPPVAGSRTVPTRPPTAASAWSLWASWLIAKPTVVAVPNGRGARRRSGRPPRRGRPVVKVEAPLRGDVAAGADTAGGGGGGGIVAQDRVVRAHHRPLAADRAADNGPRVRPPGGMHNRSGDGGITARGTDLGRAGQIGPDRHSATGVKGAAAPDMAGLGVEQDKSLGLTALKAARLRPCAVDPAAAVGAETGVVGAQTDRAGGEPAVAMGEDAHALPPGPVSRGPRW